MAKNVKHVWGIDVVRHAVEDAKLNARMNRMYVISTCRFRNASYLLLIVVWYSDIDNVTFMCGKVEDLIMNAIETFANEDFVAVVNPPRSGLRENDCCFFISLIFLGFIG